MFDRRPPEGNVRFVNSGSAPARPEDAASLIGREKAYGDGWEHLSDELRRLDLRLLLLTREQCRRRRSGPLDPFRGLVISDEEIADVLQNLAGADPSAEADVECGATIAALRQLEGRIHARLAARNDGSGGLPLPHLSRLFHLTPLEEQVLVVCLAAELDPRYAKVYAYLQDDVTRRRPSIGLVLALLVDGGAHKLEARGMFDAHAPLVKYHLCRIGEDTQTPLPLRPVSMDDRIVDYLIGARSIDSALDGVARFVFPGGERDFVIVDAGMQARIGAFIRVCRAPGSERGVILHLCGPPGSGKRGLAEAVCRDLGVALITADCTSLSLGPLPFAEAVWRMGREALLQPAALLFEGLDAWLAEPEKSRTHLDVIFDALASLSPLTFFSSRHSWSPSAVPDVLRFASLEVPLPTARGSAALWDAYLSREPGLAAGVDGHDLAGQFRLGSARIRDAVRAARDWAVWNSCAGVGVTMSDLSGACRSLATPRLTSLARRIELCQSWDDLVLPAEQALQLRDLCGHARYRHVVLGEWGFERKLPLGRGLTALFSGPPGTGKTMAAQVISGELMRDLYQIDLSQVVSKYIGETEKNLRHVFDEAEANQAVLFFDEADALFGKRAEVRDAHDRYANMEVGYLLQRMEEYEGIAILATNFRQNLDEAFVRRLRFIVDFPFPDEEHRRRIWEVTFPVGAPLGADVDFRKLARSIRLSGGHIRNIGLAAAFRAAGNGGRIGMSQLIDATRAEYQKLGQTWSGIGAAP